MKKYVEFKLINNERKRVEVESKGLKELEIPKDCIAFHFGEAESLKDNLHNVGAPYHIGKHIKRTDIDELTNIITTLSESDKKKLAWLERGVAPNLVYNKDCKNKLKQVYIGEFIVEETRVIEVISDHKYEIRTRE